MKRLRNLVLASIVLLSSCEQAFFEDEPMNTFESFYDEIDRHFSYFSLVEKDFDSTYWVGKQRLMDDNDPLKLEQELSILINLLGDGHTFLLKETKVIQYLSWLDRAPTNRLPDIGGYFTEYEQTNEVLEYGRLKSKNLGYIKINAFGRSASHFNAIDFVLNQLHETRGLIIDVRSNGGGNTHNSDLIISRFNDQSRMYVEIRQKLPECRSCFTEWQPVSTTTRAEERFVKPIVILINRGCYSATEAFVAAMSTLSNVTTVGDTTGGGSGYTSSRELPGGWFLQLSSAQSRLPDGRDYQAEGLYPDVPLWISTADSLAGIDTILERAIDSF